jgi:NADPH-dependent curcumin reductase CurA
MSKTKIQGCITEKNLDEVRAVFGDEVAEAVAEGKAKTFLEILVILEQFGKVSVDIRR